CFAVRNPRSDLEFVGYGYSELEMLVTIVTAWLNAFEYNRRFFSQGAGIPGILNLKGQVVNEKIMRAFKRELQMLVTGAQNAHRLPVTSAEGMEFVNLHSTNREMEYSAWMDLLTKLACALYSMDPAEIGFNFGNTGQQSSMGSANQVEKIAESRERGLKPLIRFLFSQLNRFVIWQIDPDFEIVAQGLRSNSEKDDLELDKMRAEVYMTVDQIRACYDQPPMEDGKGACILNPTWLQFSQAAAAQGQETPAADPMDMGGLFDAPETQQQPPQQPPQSVGTPPDGVIQQTSQPADLAASLTGRAKRPRISSFTL
ncbi:MAG TPA: phage portal protein, partial [Opitutaceae bacterium]|nr:phage portal protein [Opitutaceae bacterium]